jgi:hypothetical protein
MLLERQIEKMLDGYCNAKEREIRDDSRVFERNGPHTKLFSKTTKIRDISDRVLWKQIKMKQVIFWRQLDPGRREEFANAH